MAIQGYGGLNRGLGAENIYISSQKKYKKWIYYSNNITRNIAKKIRVSNNGEYVATSI